MEHSLNFIDLFAGAGGLSCGLEMAGHRCLLGVDFNSHAMETFQKNHPEAQSFCGDLTELNDKKIKNMLGTNEVQLVVGGPPCQGFSTVGRGDPKDKRNKLFLEFVRVVRLTNPYFFIMENVTGLLAKKNEKTLSAILKCFNDLGFQVAVQVVSTEEYGVPERRRRTIFLGSRLHKQEQISFPLPITKDCPPTVGEVLSLAQLKAADGKCYNHNVEQALIKNPLDLKRLRCIPEGRGIRYEEDEKEFLPKPLRLNVDWKNLKENRFRQTKYLRLDRKRPSPTILTHRSMYYHPTEARYLTVREAAKLQSFPNDFIFEGTVTSMWRQIGNAVPPQLGKVLGEHLKTLLKTKPVAQGKNKIKNKDNSSLKRIRGSAFIYKNEQNNSL